jgi:hypothetical protein
MASALTSPANDLAQRLSPVVEAWDADVVRRFRTLMQARSA